MDLYLDETQETHHKPDDVVPVRRLSAYALVQNEGGEVLMIKPTWNTLWELPGGGIETEESIRDGLIREFMEETGYTISVEDQPICVGEQNFFSKAHDTYYKAVLLSYRGIVVKSPAESWKMNGVIENEISEIRWVDPSILTEDNTHPIAWPAIRTIKNQGQ